MSRHISEDPLYRNKFIDPKLDFDTLSLDEQASFTDFFMKKNEREKRKREVNVSRQRTKLRSDPGLLLDQELFIEEGENLDVAVMMAEQARFGQDVSRNKNEKGKGNGKQKTILAPNVRPIKELIMEDTILPFTFDTDQSIISGKRFKFSLRSFLLNVKEINLESIMVKGFNFGNFTNDHFFLVQFFGFQNNPLSNHIPEANFDYLQGKFSFFFQGDSRPNLSVFNEGGADFGSVANGDSGGELVYYENFNRPIKLNNSVIERLTQFEMQFFRRNGSDMFKVHNVELNPVIISQSGNLSKIAIVSGGNNAIDFSESGIERNASVQPGIYSQAGNNVIEIDEGSGDKITLLPGGTYKSVELATDLQRKLNNNTGLDNNYSVVYNSTTKKFTISTTNGAIFSISWFTGGQSENGSSNKSIGTIMGFDVTADDTGANTYTSDTAVVNENSLTIEQDIAASVSIAMNATNPVNTYDCFINSGGLFTFSRKSGGIDYIMLFNTGRNKNSRIARTFGWDGNDNEDILSSDAVNSNTANNLDVVADTSPPDEVTPYAGEFNQNPFWRVIMRGHMVLGPGEESGL